MTRRGHHPGVCRWCDLPVTGAKGQPTKGTWHPDCVLAFKLIHWPAVTRAAVFERDKGICARCGRDAVAWARSRHEIHRLDQWFIRQEALRLFGPMGWHWSNEAAEAWHRQQLKTFEAHYRLQGSGHSDGWQHDHIRPLMEANGDISFWHLSNIQTLCSACHVQKGREDNARRRAAKVLAAPIRQPELNLAPA